MDFLEPNINFDPSKPFYRLVLAYVAQIHGILDLASRGMREQWKNYKEGHKAHVHSDDQLIEMVSKRVVNGYSDHVRAVLKSESSSLCGTQRLISKIDHSVKVDTCKLSNEIIQNCNDPISVFIVMSAGSLLILAWETTIDKHSTDPLWEFLRHCRNASAHKGGHFNFKYGEPRRTARWRTLSIEPQLQDTPLFLDSERKGLLHPGDCLYLLSDIEKTFY